jgi:hypothetical protein
MDSVSLPLQFTIKNAQPLNGMQLEILELPSLRSVSGSFKFFLLSNKMGIYAATHTHRINYKPTLNKVVF